MCWLACETNGDDLEKEMFIGWWQKMDFTNIGRFVKIIVFNEFCHNALNKL